MIHLLAVRELMYHDHLHHPLGQPSSISVPEHQLYDLASIEIATDKLGVVGEFFERLNEDHVRFHEGVAYRCDAVQDVFRRGRCRAGQCAYEVYVRVRALGALIDALEAEDHCRGLRMR